MQYALQENGNKNFKMYCPKEWALNIISENEYNYLKTLSQEGEYKNE